MLVDGENQGECTEQIMDIQGVKDEQREESDNSGGNNNAEEAGETREESD
jgi:hypothetical protein